MIGGIEMDWSKRVEKFTEKGYDMILEKVRPLHTKDDLWRELHQAMRKDGYRKFVLILRDPNTKTYVLMAKK